jgi:hypothetical protein
MPQENDFQISEEYVEKLFVHVLVDLWQRTHSQDQEFRIYNQLNMARLIRQLLLDGTGLFNLANKYHKLPIRFFTVDYGDPPENLEQIPNIYGDGLIPDLNNYPPGAYHVLLKLDGYLAHSPMLLGGKSFTVREIVKYVANEFGGVHLSPYLKDEDDQLLARFNNFLQVGNDGVVLNCIQQIAVGTLRALAPLKTAIQKKYDALAAAS